MKFDSVVAEWDVTESKLKKLLMNPMLSNKSNTIFRFDTCWDLPGLKVNQAIGRILKELECLKFKNRNISVNNWTICQILAIRYSTYIALEKTQFKLVFGVLEAKMLVSRLTRPESN